MAKESKHVAAFTKRHLNKGEQITAWTEGYTGKMLGSGKDAQRNGVLIVTNIRVAFYRKGFIGEIIETIPLDKLTSVERQSAMGHRTIHMHTSHDDLEFKTFDKDGETLVIEAMEAGRHKNVGKQSVDGGDVVERLKKLSSLKDAGVITDSEFAEKKAELMAQI
ncbi:PH domain-containing protein [Aeromonas veronii]|uniref:SHOCT domain-containing protein n=1 Tax=Aeromonas veronii TaxID=654 RepID=UPI0021E8E0E4|nr:SHOCT domain-containing protein [Aeromonas veronii]MCV3283458.1 PH domain-containing protein [Aeromonas veronii]